MHCGQAGGGNIRVKSQFLKNSQHFEAAPAWKTIENITLNIYENVCACFCKQSYLDNDGKQDVLKRATDLQFVKKGKEHFMGEEGK